MIAASRLPIRSHSGWSNSPLAELNDIGQIHLICQNPLVFDKYTDNRMTGSFILIDELDIDPWNTGFILIYNPILIGVIPDL